MKQLDYLLRDWRYRVAAPFVNEGSFLLDIGGYDGSFLKKVSDRIERGVCIDPLTDERTDGKLVFIKSRIDRHLPFPDSSFDIVTMLAVFEHLGPFREAIAHEVSRVLKPRGIALLTVPHRAVDSLLRVLRSMNLIDASTLDEHDHVTGTDIVGIFEGHGLRLMQWSRFQFGLNNLFVFEKIVADTTGSDCLSVMRART